MASELESSAVVCILHLRRQEAEIYSLTLKVVSNLSPGKWSRELFDDGGVSGSWQATHSDHSA